MLFVCKDLVLHWQIDPGTVHQVNNRQTIFHRYFLRSQILLSSDRKPSAGFDGGVVGHDHHQTSMDITQNHHNPSGRATAFLFVHAQPGQCPNFKTIRAGIQQSCDAFSSRHFTLFMEAGHGLGPSALGYILVQYPEILHEVIKVDFAFGGHTV